MKMSGTQIIRLVLLSVLLAFLRDPVAAATIQAASPSLVDVSTAVAKAANGDTVSIPAGSSSWAGTLNITKPITLQGAGADGTILTRNGAVISCTLQIDAPIRITGIGFTNTTTSSSSVMVNGKKANGVNATISRLRIDHCKFYLGKRSLTLNGWVEGVIDHNTYVNCNIGVGVAGDNNASWTRPIQPGSIHTLCIEDNTFLYDNNISSAPNQSIYCQEGARVTVRRNTMDSTLMTKYNGMFFDSHGNSPSGSPILDACASVTNNGIRGQPLLEVYENIVNVHHTWQHADYRGGVAFVYNNHYSYLSGAVGGTLVLKEEEVGPYGVFNPLRTLTSGGYPANDQIGNSHFWGNTMTYKGVTTNITNATLKCPTEESAFIKEGRDYWMSPPSSTTGKPLGQYYPYTPLVYPHPLVTSTLAPPTNLAVVP
jgi:hypothetical protein